MNHPSICVFRLSSLGDIVLTSVLLRCLKKQYPNSNIVFVVSSRYVDVVRFNPHISHIVEVDTKKGIKELLRKRHEILQKNNGKKFDIVLDLHRNLRTKLLRFGTGKEYSLVDKFRKQKLQLVHKKIGLGEPVVHIVDRYIKTAQKWNVKNDADGLELWLESEKKKMVYEPKNRKNTSQVVGIAPGARHFTKRYPKEKFIELIIKLRDKFPFGQFVLFGGYDEKEMCQEIERSVPFSVTNLAGERSILESTVELDKCSVLITNDSGLMHIAAARRVPVMAIFGSTVKEFGFEPYGVEYKIIEKNIPCRPCSHIGREQCPLGHFDCMNTIETQEIIDNVFL